MIVYQTVKISSVFKNKELLKELKSLTLDRFSGMSQDLRYFERLSKFKDLNVYIFLATEGTCHVAWAMLSFDGSQVVSNNPQIRFYKDEDSIIQIFVKPAYRGRKIASKLMKLASKNVGSKRLCAFVWDDVSKNFYSKFKTIKQFNIEAHGA